MYASLRVILEEEQDLNLYPDPNQIVRKFDILTDLQKHHAMRNHKLSEGPSNDDTEQL